MRRFNSLRSKALVFSLTLLLTIVAVAFLRRSLNSSSAEVQWAEARQGDLIVDLIESGEIQAVNSRLITAPSEWRVEMQIVELAPEGSTVQAGDVLVRIDPSTLQTDLANARDELDYQRAELRRLQIEQASRLAELEDERRMAEFSREEAKLQLENLKFEADVRREQARLDLLKAELALQEAEAKIKAQKILDAKAREKVQAQIAQEQSRVKEIERRIGEFTLRAPIPGLVVYYENKMWDLSKVKVGDKVREQRPLIELPDLSKMQVVCTVNEVDLAKLRPGLKALVTLDAVEGKTFSGEVGEISKLAQGLSTSPVKLFEVKIPIAESDPMLKPGMSARARIILEEHHRVTMVPCGAVHEREGRPVVFPMKKYPKAVPVKLGPRSDYWIVVREGVKAGEKLAWKSPEGPYEKFGHFSFTAKRNSEKSLQSSFAAMEKLGLVYDYEKNRGKASVRGPAAVGGPLGLPPDVKAMMEKMARGTIPNKIDSTTIRKGVALPKGIPKEVPRDLDAKRWAQPPERRTKR